MEQENKIVAKMNKNYLPMGSHAPKLFVQKLASRYEATAATRLRGPR